MATTTTYKGATITVTPIDHSVCAGVISADFILKVEDPKGRGVDHLYFFAEHKAIEYAKTYIDKWQRLMEEAAARAAARFASLQNA